MSQTQTVAGAQAKKHDGHKLPEPAPMPEPAQEFVPLAATPVGPLGEAGDGTPASRAARLSDPRLHTVQRQMMVAQIGQVQGNRHLQHLIADRPHSNGQPATLPLAKPHPADVQPAPTHLQRYQAGETGHGGIEQRALGAVGFAPDEVNQIYLGNWMRDLSQLPPAALPLVNLLALGEFGREVTAAELGTYVPSEHLDNPEGGGTIEDPRVQALEHSTNPTERAQFEAALAKLSPEQRAAYDAEQAHRLEITEASKRSGLPVYLERGKFHAKEKLTEAVTRGANAEGRRAMGDALHAVEDYYSHSNFVEVAIWTLYGSGAPVSHLVDRMANSALGTNAALVGGLGSGGRPQIVTGTYAPGGNDWVSRIELLKSEIEHGNLTRAFVIGFLRKSAMTAEDLGRQVGEAIGAPIGGVLGAIGGGASGGAQGVDTGGRLGGALGRGLGGSLGGLIGRGAGSLIGGAIGAVGGAVSGWRSGSQTGAEVGGDILGTLGRIGVTLVGGQFLVSAQAAAWLLSKLPALQLARAGMIALLDRAVEQQTAASARQASARGLTGPTHSQLAKDAPDHPLFGVSVQLAEAAVRDIGRAMQTAWAAGAAAGSPETEAVTALVDKYVSEPASDRWWEPIVLAAATRK